MTTTPAQKPKIPTPKLWTVDDYYRMTELGILAPDERTELLDGEIILMAAKNPPHVAITKRTSDYLRNLLVGIADIRVQDPVRLSNNSEPEPDIAVVRIDERDYIERHPTPSEIFLLVEVADATLKQDLENKALAYAKSGIIEYWVIDVNTHQVHIFRDSDQKAYQQKSVLTQNASTALVAFPNINIVIQEFFP